ncbi:MAG: 3-hexulose-6-phosphate synthase [Parcubacteria group bacterium ADurb.Bin216]|nr:MAG: 3-hexulose-6-phosphate synthase [Parcubacteria group bacterium ADurb.Bin216]
MKRTIKTKLNERNNHLQIAFNSSLDDARRIIFSLPVSDRIILEAGTPLIKMYGISAVRMIKDWYTQRARSQGIFDEPYVVADLKTMDRGETEVSMAHQYGASAVIALGSAPVETLDSFVDACESYGIDPMIDMMNVENPLAVLHKLKRVPPIVILHRGVDEERFNREKQIPLHDIRRIKGAYDVMISIAGGDTIREVQRSVFNDADIVVVWKSVFQNSSDTIDLVNGFLSQIK